MSFFQFSKRLRSLNTGLTVIELLIVIAVLAILLAVAMPDMQATLARNQLLGQANELATAMSMARSEAISRNVQAGVCASADGATCSGQDDDWDKFALVFVDLDRDSGFDDGSEPLIKSLGAHPAVDQFASASAYYFNSRGFSTTNAVSSVQVCHDDLDVSDRCRTVTIAPTGSVTVRHSTKSS